MYEYWQVDVEMENDDFMDRVGCYFDGVLLGIDYSADSSGDYPVYSFYLSPHALGLTRADFFGRAAPSGLVYGLSTGSGGVHHARRRLSTSAGRASTHRYGC